MGLFQRARDVVLARGCLGAAVGKVHSVFNRAAQHARQVRRFGYFGKRGRHQQPIADVFVPHQAVGITPIEGARSLGPEGAFVVAII